jgi:hypothetical protein
MMMTGSCGESCGAVAAKYAAMISSNKNMLFLLESGIIYTRLRGRRPGTDPRERAHETEPEGVQRDATECTITHIYDLEQIGFG